MRRPAYAAAALILGLGVFALLLPARFAALVTWAQTPPYLYIVAAIRLLMGVALLAAAEGSRARLAVAFLGFVLVAGGIVTPIVGRGLAMWIVDAWVPGGGAVVRGWGIAALVLGGFAFWALQPRQHKHDADDSAIRSAP